MVVQLYILKHTDRVAEGKSGISLSSYPKQHKYTIAEKCTKTRHNSNAKRKLLPHQQPTPARFQAKKVVFQAFGTNSQLLQLLLLEAQPKIEES